MDARLLALDLGTSAVKALVVHQDGQVLGRGESSYPIRHPAQGRAEQDPEAWWQAAVRAARQALSSSPRGGEIAATGLCGQMHGTVLLGERNQVLAPAVIWPDQRTQPQAAEVERLVGRDRLVELAGSPAATGFQGLTLRWFQGEKPELWRRVRKALLPKDYLRFRLTGRLATDPSDACGTLLLDIHTRDWSAEILETLGIERALLPPVQASASIAGELSPEAAESIGLPPGFPVVTGAGDTPAALLGAGAIHPQVLLVNLSTGGQTALPVEEALVDRSGRIHTFCAALAPGTGQAGWYLLGGTLSAGLSLRWLRDQVFGTSGEQAYEAMSALAAQVPPGARGLLFLPYLLGERTPHMNPQARGLFLGLTLQHGRAELARAVMEGVVLACYEAYLALLETGKAPPEKLVLAGGGARSPAWRQIVADVFGLPVNRLVVPEQSAAGAALLAGAGIGLFDAGEAAQEWARYDPPIEPDSRRHARYQEILPIFQRAYQMHREDFIRLGDLS
jgi:xylulokinase